MRRRTRTRIDLTHWDTYIIFIGVFLSFYVFLSSRLITIGYSLKEEESVYQDLLTVNQNYRTELLKLYAPESVRELMKRHNVALEIPSDWAFVEVPVREETQTAGSLNGKAEANTQ